MEQGDTMIPALGFQTTDLEIRRDEVTVMRNGSWLRKSHSVFYRGRDDLAPYSVTDGAQTLAESQRGKARERTKKANQKPHMTDDVEKRSPEGTQSYSLPREASSGRGVCSA
ncbi:hypothetical protein BaRGS_00009359 [Batillaria attramentaria]|uniref:Uncharacterized protein n=1 Tax=Batillaria attramentaria TaxID=370345 RepID=A0ABD0LIM0_9CAEN